MPIIDRIDIQTITEGSQGPIQSICGIQAGEMIPQRRCAGLCCQAFTLGCGLSLEDLQEILLRKQLEGPWPFKASTGRVFYSGPVDLPLLVALIIPIGSFSKSNPPPIGNPALLEDEPIPFFTCRAFVEGNCTIYDQRPAMCRDYPLSGSCEYCGCVKESEGRHVPEVPQIEVAEDPIKEKEVVDACR